MARGRVAPPSKMEPGSFGEGFSQQERNGSRPPSENSFSCVEGRKAVFVIRSEKHFSSDRREGHKRGEGPAYELVFIDVRKAGL